MRITLTTYEGSERIFIDVQQIVIAENENFTEIAHGLGTERCLRVKESFDEIMALMAVNPKKTPISVLDLSARSINALSAWNIDFVEQIKSMNDNELLKISNLGYRSLKEIRLAVENYSKGKPWLNT